MMAALQVLTVMRHKGVSLSRLIKAIPKYPSVGEDILVKEKLPLDKLSKLQETKKKFDEKLGDKGRIIIRYSGTENKLRLLVEGEEYSKIAKALKELSKAAKGELC